MAATLWMLQQRVADWMRSPEGQAALQETSKRAAEATEKMRLDMIITHEQMSRFVDRIV